MLDLPLAAYDVAFFSTRFHAAASEVVRGAKYWVRAQGESLGIPPMVQDLGLLVVLFLGVFYVTKAMGRFSRAVILLVVAVLVAYGALMPDGWL